MKIGHNTLQQLLLIRNQEPSEMNEKQSSLFQRNDDTGQII